MGSCHVRCISVLLTWAWECHLTLLLTHFWHAWLLMFVVYILQNLSNLNLWIGCNVIYINAQVDGFCFPTLNCFFATYKNWCFLLVCVFANLLFYPLEFKRILFLSKGSRRIRRKQKVDEPRNLVFLFRNHCIQMLCCIMQVGYTIYNRIRVNERSG